MITSSADSAKLAAVTEGGYIYTSNNSGATWTEQLGAGQRAWLSIASSADGSNLIAGVNSGSLYTSADSGVSWTARTGAGTGSWYSVASSSDGTKLVAASNGGYIYTSSDSGVTWVAQTSAGIRGWRAISSSADGAHVVAGAANDYLYVSSDSGVTWSQRTSVGQSYWYSTASSASGDRLVAADYVGYIWTSSDSGATWIQRSTPSAYWLSVASSADGSHLAAARAYGLIYTSSDSGVSWTPHPVAGQRYWNSICSSADGAALAATVLFNGATTERYIYTSPTSGVERCDDGNLINGDGCSGSCILEYLGDGIINNGELCDDGNSTSGDGCSSTGVIEPGYSCSHQPSVCSIPTSIPTPTNTPTPTETPQPIPTVPSVYRGQDATAIQGVITLANGAAPSEAIAVYLEQLGAQGPLIASIDHPAQQALSASNLYARSTMTTPQGSFIFTDVPLGSSYVLSFSADNLALSKPIVEVEVGDFVKLTASVQSQILDGSCARSSRVSQVISSDGEAQKLFEYTTHAVERLIRQAQSQISDQTARESLLAHLERVETDLRVSFVHVLRESFALPKGVITCSRPLVSCSLERFKESRDRYRHALVTIRRSGLLANRLFSAATHQLGSSRNPTARKIRSLHRRALEASRRLPVKTMRCS